MPIAARKFLWTCALLLLAAGVYSSCDSDNCMYSNDTTSVSTRQAPNEEDVAKNVRTTASPAIFVTLPPVTGQTGRARAINFTVGEPHVENGILMNSSNATRAHASVPAITTFISEDEDDRRNQEQVSGLSMTTCLKGGLTYSDGERIEDGCDSVCTCSKGRMECTERCTGAYFRRDKKVNDPLCTEKLVDDDPCCSILVCAADTETEPLELCTHNNRTYRRGEHFDDGCTQVCTCEASGKLSCKQRCPPQTGTKASSDKCVEVPDPTDPCCTKMLCDVAASEEDESVHRDVPKLKLVSAKYVNTSTIVVKLDGKPDERSAPPNVELSRDRILWASHKLRPGGFLLAPGLDAQYARLENTDDFVIVQNSDVNIKSGSKKEDQPKASCIHNGEVRKLGEEFYKSCESFCVCLETGIKCLKIECPTYFGLDVLEPSCVEWETAPADFVPNAPHCCPESVRCKSNGSCLHEGVTYQNWQELPMNVTGCEKRCYCEMSRIECQNVCPPVPATPPATLPCAPHRATLAHIPDDDCCVMWTCSSTPGFGTFPTSRFPAGSAFHQSHDEISVHQIDAIDGQTVRLLFSVSPLLVGLHGRVEVRYTDSADDNIANWNVQEFTPPDELIATQQLEFDLIGLKPDTQYKVKVTLMLRDLHNTPTSQVYRVHTPTALTTSTMPPMIPIQPDLAVTEVNSTRATVIWRKLTEFELQFVDGVQLRYKEVTGKVYSATPLIHRAVTRYQLVNLKPETEYELRIFFIPFAAQTTELHAENMIRFTTSSVPDPYGFNVILEIQLVKATTIEVAWSGVPYPEDKYVNIYRAIYQSDSGKGDFSTFKIAKRDSPKKTTIADLKPGTRYRLWLEVYLTNGKIKTSNVQDFVTKPRSVQGLGTASQQGKLSAAGLTDGTNDYYGPLVIVAILAAIAILSTLILLMILLKRHTQNKAAISTPTRVSQSAYDNPTYKVEIQQETMGL